MINSALLGQVAQGAMNAALPAAQPISVLPEYQRTEYNTAIADEQLSAMVGPNPHAWRNFILGAALFGGATIGVLTLHHCFPGRK